MNGDRPRKPNGGARSSERPQVKTGHGLGDLGRLTGLGPPAQPPRPPERRDHSGAGGGRAERDPAPLRIPLPRRVCDEVSRRWRQSHPGLAYDKFAFGWSERWRLETSNHANPKREFLDACVEAYSAPEHPARELYRRALARRKALLEDLAAQGFHVARRVARSAWRVVSGLGIAHPFEVGFVLDRQSGVPLLPGSSVKGAARAWAEQALEDQHATGAWSGKTGAALDAVFGPRFDDDRGERARPAQGAVVFFDAWPVTWPRLEVDLLNPHYKDYYEGKTGAPADYLAPNPIFFLTVAEGQAYEFAVAVRGDVSAGVLDQAGVAAPDELARLALDALLAAASEAGLGGKTAVGYGYFA